MQWNWRAFLSEGKITRNICLSLGICSNIQKSKWKQILCAKCLWKWKPVGQIFVLWIIWLKKQNGKSWHIQIIWEKFSNLSEVGSISADHNPLAEEKVVAAVCFQWLGWENWLDCICISLWRVYIFFNLTVCLVHGMSQSFTSLFISPKFVEWSEPMWF